jgi:hypothetical protein
MLIWKKNRDMNSTHSFFFFTEAGIPLRWRELSALLTLPTPSKAVVEATPLQPGDEPAGVVVPDRQALLGRGSRRPQDTFEEPAPHRTHVLHSRRCTASVRRGPPCSSRPRARRRGLDLRTSGELPGDIRGYVAFLRTLR